MVVLDILLRDNTLPADNVRRLVGAGHTVVAISSQNHPQRIRDFIAAGAHSYVHKVKDGAELCQAIRAAAAREPYVSYAHAAAIESATGAGSPALSIQEREVVRLYASGMTIPQVAERMHIKASTARSHLDRVRDKYGSEGRTARTKLDLAQRAGRGRHPRHLGRGGVTSSKPAGPIGRGSAASRVGAENCDGDRVWRLDNFGMHEMGSENLPFRWDLVTPDQLGSLLDGTVLPSLWFLDELVDCAGKVLARSGNGDLVFVGRSLDSMFDLLSGALADATDRRHIHRLPFSFQRPAIGPPSARRWRRRPLTPAEQSQARRVMATVDLTPHALARRDRPATFVDVVHGGSTFTELFDLLRAWISDERAAWPIIRRKLRFVGVTSRVKTSPKAYRWHQHAAWAAELPASAIINVSLSPWVWSYFGDQQTKLTRSFRPERWLADAEEPDRGDRTRQALAEAVALVAYGRSAQGRRALARAVGREPALAQPWLRTLVANLNKNH